MKHLGIKEIQKIIPHRHPFLLVDYIEDYEPGEYAVGYKMCDLQRGLFCRTFSTGAGDAGSADRRSTGAGRCSSGSDDRKKIKESSVILVGLRTASSAEKLFRVTS